MRTQTTLAKATEVRKEILEQRDLGEEIPIVSLVKTREGFEVYIGEEYPKPQWGKSNPCWNCAHCIGCQIPTMIREGKSLLGFATVVSMVETLSPVSAKKDRVMILECSAFVADKTRSPDVLPDHDPITYLPEQEDVQNFCKKQAEVAAFWKEKRKSSRAKYFCPELSGRFNNGKKSSK